MADTRGSRLRTARKNHFTSARSAAEALGVPVSTYNAHERAESPGGRDYSPEEAAKYARRFKVSPEFLLTGRKVAPTDPDDEAPPRMVPIVGYVGAGAQTHAYAVAAGQLDETEAPEGSTESTVAVEIRGDSLGSLFDRWLVFYDDVRSPITSDLIGRLCVVGLADDRVLIKKVRRSRDGAFDLLSNTEEPIRGVQIVWAARVKNMVPR